MKKNEQNKGWPFALLLQDDSIKRNQAINLNHRGITAQTRKQAQIIQADFHRPK